MLSLRYFAFVSCMWTPSGRTGMPSERTLARLLVSANHFLRHEAFVIHVILLCALCSGEAKSLVSQVLSSSPRNVNEFKHIAAEEGMLVTDLMA